MPDPETIEYVKYGRTLHLPWSPGASADDKIHTEPPEVLYAGEEIVVSEKLDGENTTIYSNGHCHARSLTSPDHPSRKPVRQLAKRLAGDMPAGMRICGENVYAKHSIAYTNLPAFFLVFGIYLDGECLGWDETLEWCDLLYLTPVPTLYRGPWDEARVKACWTGCSTASPGDQQEGYVVRPVGRFLAKDLSRWLAKFVRACHVQTSEHWLRQAITPNRLRSGGGGP